MKDDPIKNDSKINNESTSNEDRYATVSIRNMNLLVWYKAGYSCKLKGITLSEYITQLILNDLKKDSRN